MAVKVIAHRGAPIYHLENTISSFFRALDLGADMIELDVRLTRDGHLIVMHDNTVDRVTEGSGLVKHFTLNDIRTFKVGRENIPTVEEVVNIFKNRIRLNFDVKVVEAISPMKKLLSKHGLEEKVLISSFKKEVIEAFEDWNPQIKTGLLCWYADESNISFATENTVENIHPFHLFLTEEKVEELHQLGFKVNTWTVDYAWSIRRAIRNRVDGIITNRPLLLSRIRKVAEAMVLET